MHIIALKIPAKQAPTNSNHTTRSTHGLEVTLSEIMTSIEALYIFDEHK